MAHEDIYEEFCKWSPEHAKMVKGYAPWGSTSIVIWLNSGMMYKVKRHGEGKFVMQTVTKADVDKKFGKGE